jgi:hypothetical protein
MRDAPPQRPSRAGATTLQLPHTPPTLSLFSFPFRFRLLCKEEDPKTLFVFFSV